MAQSFAERVARVDWSHFETAYGRADRVPAKLLRLAVGGGPDAEEAAGDLWGMLCHQHAYVSSAALPALPFLLEVLDRADEAVAVEILDILLGFASCTAGPHPEAYPGVSPWVFELRAGVLAYRPRLAEFASHADRDIAEYAQLVLEFLGKPGPGG